MLNKVLEGECAVCHQPIPKDRIHYGGVSCYSCRAFFRRNTQREELPVCKGEGMCVITYVDRKQCSACRYAACLRIGMKPELVLTEDDKKRRFKKFLRKKETECAVSPVSGYDQDPVTAGSLWTSDSADSSPPPLEPVSSKYPNFMTTSFQNNLQLLFARKSRAQYSAQQPEHAEDTWSHAPAPATCSVSPPPGHLLAPRVDTFLAPINLSPAKDSEALKYFKTRGWFSPRALVSPNQCRQFSVSPYNQAELFLRPAPALSPDTAHAQDFSDTAHAQDFSLRSAAERKSVITFPETVLRIKAEPGLYEDEDSFPQNLSLKREAPEPEEDEDEYVHKKFRTHVEKICDEDEEGCRLQQPRQSVIMRVGHI